MCNKKNATASFCKSLKKNPSLFALPVNGRQDLALGEVDENGRQGREPLVQMATDKLSCEWN